MSKNTYGILILLALLFAVAGRYVLFSLPVPASADIELQRVEEFFATQIYTAIGLGAVIGAVAGFIARRRIRHLPSDRGIDYLGRVVSYGVRASVSAVVAVLVADTIMAAIWSLEPLSPLDKVLLLVPSGLFLVLLAFAFVASLVTYAMVSRSITWGGQYALAPAPKT